LFSEIVPHIEKLLSTHHSLYSGQCKGEYWEELCSKALIEAGLGSDWKPDFNHTTGKDQSTDAGIRISNKCGKITADSLEISGSRLTKHKTLEDKIDFISQHHDDYIFCLATDHQWDYRYPLYYFVVVDSRSLCYDQADWRPTTSMRGPTKGDINGWKTTDDLGFTAKIVISMSCQLWTTIHNRLLLEVHPISLTA